MTDWEVVIGLEVHVQLATATKAFSPSATAFGAPPNSLTDPTVLGLPGALPTFNARALEYALRLGVAVGAKIRRRSRFARKHYFYPDLPKGYQISQYDEPLCEGGAIGGVRLTRIHLEEDAGKLVHGAAGTSRVDLNRAGVPLVEVVSEPDLRSAEAAAEYMRALNLLVRYLGISEADMEKGQMRCDANVSLRPRGAERYGTRTELKNINSFRFVQKAIEHEVGRQRRILDDGGTIVQETRLWDADAGQSQSMRGKEEAMDYRYFPDPDLPPLVVDDAMLERVKASLPELPEARHARLVAAGVSADDARTLVADPELGDHFDQALAVYPAGARGLAAWILSERGRQVSPAHLASLVKLVDDAVISGKIAKDVLATMIATGDAPDAIVEREGLRQITDTGAIEALARDVIAKNGKQVAQYKGGKEGVLGFLVGALIKASGGKANPALASELLKKLLAE